MMPINSFRDHLMKLAAAKPRTTSKVTKALVQHDGNTSEYYNASLQKDQGAQATRNDKPNLNVQDLENPERTDL
jgi:hypothetical protein